MIPTVDAAVAVVVPEVSNPDEKGSNPNQLQKILHAPIHHKHSLWRREQRRLRRNRGSGNEIEPFGENRSHYTGESEIRISVEFDSETNAMNLEITMKK